MRKIVAAVLVLLIVAAAWWYASPIWTLRAMRDAAKEHDAARLSAYVDYPALREDLKADLGRYVMSEAAKRPGDAGSKLGAVIATAFLGPIVDAAVSPEGVEAMLAVQNRKESQAPRPVPASAGDDPVIDRDGFDSFRVHGKDASKGALVFHRSGLGWKLVGVDLPASDR